MLDNEYLHFTVIHDVQYDFHNRTTTEIGAHQCNEISHLAQLYSQDTILKKFGTLYCINPLKQDQKVQGMSQLGYPTKRIKVYINYCRDEHLTKIKSLKKCKKREDVWLDDIFKDLHMSIHYNRINVNLNNVDGLYGFSNTTENLMVKEN